VIYDMIEITVDGVTNRYTSAANIVGHDGHNYAPAPVKRGAITMSGQISDTDVQITVPVDHEIYDNFLSYNGEMVSNFIKISRLVDGNRIPLFNGELAKIRVSGGEATLTAIPRVSLESQMVPRGVFSRQGWRLPYDDEEDFSTGLRVTEVTDPNRLAVELENTVGNPINWDISNLRYGVVKARGIVTPIIQVATKGTSGGEWYLWTADFRPDLSVGDIITGVMGTDQTLSDVDQTFRSAPNFSGFPHLMERD